MNKEIKQIFDAFGTEVKIGDWIYFAGNYVNEMKVAKISAFTKNNNPYYIFVANEEFVKTGKVYKYNKPSCNQKAFVKCTDQVLIETLEKSIK